MIGDAPYHGGVTGASDTPMMGGVTYHCKTPLNIDIYPSTLFFFANIGHKYDFEVGLGGPW